MLTAIPRRKRLYLAWAKSIDFVAALVFNMMLLDKLTGHPIAPVEWPTNNM